MPIRPALIAALALTLAPGLWSCQSKVSRPACPAGQVCLEMGSSTEPATLDPQKANLLDEAAVISNMIVGLTTDAADASPIPGMATSWETSPDGLTWTFHLRDALWSDGTPVTADDFVYAYRRILAPETASIYAYIVYILKNGQALNEGKAAPEALGARAIDAHTLVLTLEHPAPYLPGLLKHQSFFPVPRHVVEKLGDAWVKPGNYVANGPYVLSAWKLGDYIRLTRNPRFWDADRVCVDRADYVPASDVVSAERRVKRGELDTSNTFQSNRIGRLRSPGQMPDYVRTHVSLATSYLSFNTRDVPALKDKRVRRALSESIDRDFITQKLLRAGQRPAYAFVPQEIANYKAGPATAWAGLSLAARQDEARRLLAEAGYTPDRPLELTIKSANTNDTLLLMEAIQADWRGLGVKVTLQQNESQVAFAAYRTRDFQVGSMSWYADFNDPINFLALMRSDTGAQNYGDYANPKYDALLDAADREPDAARRADLLARAEQIMLDDEAIVPLFVVVNRALVNPKVTGWVDNAENFHRVRWMCVRGYENRQARPAR